MKKVVIAFAIGFAALQVSAQGTNRTKGKTVVGNEAGTSVVKSKGNIKDNIIFSVGAAVGTPSSAVKDNAYGVNSPAINADVYFPLFASKKGWDGVVKGKTFGLNVSSTYDLGGKGSPTTPLPSAFAVTGQTGSNVVYRGGSPAQAGFRMGAGPQVNFNIGNYFTISPMILGEYFSMTQKTLSAVQTTTYNGKDYEFNLTTMPETKTSGFAVTPKLRLQYLLSNTIGIYVQGAYTTGPKINTTISKLMPNGNPQTPGNTYNLQQLQTATYVNGETKSTAYNAMSFGGGLVVSFGKRPKPLNEENTNSSGSLSATSGGSNGQSTHSTPTKKVANIDKGWDGTVKGLFLGQYASTLVSSKNGVENIVSQINKQGKGKATIETYNNKQFIKVVTTKDDKSFSEFYPVDDYGKTGKIIAGGGGLKCNPDASCFNCEPRPIVGGGYQCFCSTDAGPCTSVPGGITLNAQMSATIDKGLLLTLENNGTTLSNGAIKNIADLVITQFSKAEKIKSLVKKEGNIEYVETTFEDKGHGFVMLGRLIKDGTFYTLIDKQLLMCAGSCSGTSYDCSLNGWGSVGVHTYCNCSTSCKFIVVGFPSPDGPTRTVGNSTLEEIIIWNGF